MAKNMGRILGVGIFGGFVLFIFIYTNEGRVPLTKHIKSAKNKVNRKHPVAFESVKDNIVKAIPSSKDTSKNTKRKLLTTEHDKWIIVTSINTPTEDVKKLSKLKGWRVLVVGDKKSPADFSFPNCFFLDVEKQLSLGYATTELINFNSYARKNIGYLFAIEHGAKIIYDTDDDNSPTTDNIGFDPFLNMTYLSYDASIKGAENPYAHFGQSTVWPRGYPLDKIGNTPQRTYRKCVNPKVLVQQGVVNGDPDVDAIYRITRKDNGIDLKLKFDASAQPLMYPKNKIAPFNSQNTLHLYDAFWGLVLPQTVAFRVCDIWRGYWMQRLLWDINGHIGFFPPNAYTYRNAHSFLDDFVDEKQMYHESGKFVEFLVNWKPESETFFDRVVELSKKMVERNFWGEKDVLLVQNWLKDLIKIGYQPPEISKEENDNCGKKIFEALPVEQPSSYLRLQDKLKNIMK